MNNVYFVCVLFFCGGGAVVCGLHALMVYKGTPGAMGKTPQKWPQNDLVALSADKPQLMMFAHPMCPCTKASLAELEVLAAKAPGKFEATVVFIEPESETDAWSKTVSVDLAR